jgi:hypothetical protein
MRTGFWWLLVVLAALLIAHSASGAGDDNFETQTISVAERVLAVGYADLYRDAGQELLLFIEDETGARRLRILTQGLGRKFSTSPIADILLPETVFGRQVIDFDRDGRMDLLLLAMDALYQVQLGETAGTDTLVQLAEFTPLYTIPQPGTILPLEIAFDLDGDGGFELLLPCWQGVGLFSRNEGEYRKIRQFKIKQRSGMPFASAQLRSPGGEGMQFRLARVAVHDLNTDRIPDVFIESNAGLAVFYQTGSMQFAEAPDEEIGVRGSYLRNLLHSSSGFGDLNGDGLLDFCRVFTQGVDYDVKSLIEIFLGNIHDGYPSRPTKRIVLDEFVVGLTLIDLNGNGSASLVVATQSLSTISMVKSLMVKRIPVKLKIFESKAGVIDDEPVAVKQVSCGLELLRQQFPGRFIACLEADLDSDLRHELAVVNHDNELEIYRGDSESIFADKPATSMSLSAPRHIDAADLDGDRRSDLIISGSDEDGREAITIIWPK